MEYIFMLMEEFAHCNEYAWLLTLYKEGAHQRPVLKEMVAAGELGRINYIYSHRLNLGTIRTEEDVKQHAPSNGDWWRFVCHRICRIKPNPVVKGNRSQLRSVRGERHIRHPLMVHRAQE